MECEWGKLRHVLSRQRCSMLLLCTQKNPVAILNAAFNAKRYHFVIWTVGCWIRLHGLSLTSEY